MAFFSLHFAIFFVVVLGLYWAAHKNYALRSGVLILASYAFYASFNPYYLIILFWLTAQDYLISRRMAKTESPGARKAMLFGSLTLTLGILGFFKYTNFIINIPADILEWFGEMPEHPQFKILHPIGISFYVFQTISYIVDVHRKRIEPHKNFLDHMLYMAFFPRLLLGPIVRSQEFVHQIGQTPKVTREQFGLALFFLIMGLVKKQIFGDFLVLNILDRVYDIPLMYSSLEVIAAIYATLMHIYCDFSGYTDIALGLALLMGYQLPINFDFPFKSRNLRVFWRKWHITLSFWLRDYLYIPLGGSRGKTWKTYRNLIITFTLAGLWHGATWGWLVWGFLMGVVLSITRYTFERRKRLGQPTEPPGWRKYLGIFGTCFYMFFTSPLFWAKDFRTIGDMGTAIMQGVWTTDNLSPWVVAALATGTFFMWFPDKWYQAVRRTFLRLPWPVQIVIFAAAMFALTRVASSEMKSFVYGNF